MTRKSDKIENVLLRIIANNTLSEQNQIVEKLKEEGIDLPQSTLSRWLKKLNINKINQRYQVLTQPQFSRIPIFSIKASMPNLLVIQTLPGHASAIGEQIDQQISKPDMEKVDPYHGVIGTIAGDNTLLVIMENEKALKRFKTFYEQEMV